MSKSTSQNPVSPDQPDELDEAIDLRYHNVSVREEECDFEAKAAEIIAKASWSTQDRIRLVATETALVAPGSLMALLQRGLLRGMLEGVDEDVIGVLEDIIKSGDTQSATFLTLAKEAHLVEICLPNLCVDFESGRFPRPKELTFEKVQEALLANNAEGLLKAAKLESAQFFEVDEAGNLVLSDGTDEVPQSTLRQNYPTARKEVHAAGLELFKRAEYERLQSGERKYDARASFTWLESGENPSSALRAYWDNASVYVPVYDPAFQLENLGARRLLRVPLKLGA